MCTSKSLDLACVAATLFLITMVPLTSQLFVLIPWLSWKHGLLSREGVLLLLPFNVGVLSIWANYYLACATDPGKVPHGYHPNDPKYNQGFTERKKSARVSLRFCRKCNAFKPPRTHHCSECRRCVLKMDHHCPWINNCVGHRNQGYFVRFVCSVGFSASYLLFLYGLYLTRLLNSQQPQFHSLPTIDKHYAPPPSNLALTVMILNVLACVILLLSVGLLSLWQLYYLACNTTTIESLENDKIDSLVRKGTIPPYKRYPYDLGGSIANMQCVLGPRVWLWWVPLPAPGDGLRFSVNPALLGRGGRVGAHERGKGGAWSWLWGTSRSFEAHAGKDLGDLSLVQEGEVDLNWPPEEYYVYKNGYSVAEVRDAGLDALVESSGGESSSDGDYVGRSGSARDIEDDGSGNHGRRRLVRRGSEGYLVKSVGFDGAAPVRGPYVSESESEGDESEEVSSDDDLPLDEIRLRASVLRPF
ncbi:DHHC palmitoyltransferase-domain-containing protein [Chytriomyces sp. MP71]|nr:DHHC palmitoyltransferase-domain-containing protein [Chytriomyces sp. MP71]